jgi:hypothetical protein
VYFVVGTVEDSLDLVRNVSREGRFGYVLGDVDVG